ncbi:MAG: DUF2279 domain-containing protein [Bacteroidetes bacterium HGW-Bacteroidetes-22]|nr:MAG: DUF2279 domain-containing protein [Bacteroidetes bacterium HGW-Bacteroidetes-22]
MTKLMSDNLFRIFATAILILGVTSIQGHVSEPDTIFQKVNDSVSSAPDTSCYVKQRRYLPAVVTAEASLYVVSLAGLWSMWYKDYPQSHFHFFNDNDEWLQIDKAGHFVTSYYISRLTSYSVEWAGMSHRNSVWYGGIAGFTYMTTIEILDGFSSEWGASAGDLTANTFGAILFIGQELLWKDQRITLKYSWHPTKYADYRPDILGRNTFQQMVKDYNGTTLWASGNLYAFGAGRSWIPRWINIAVGYGAEGMTGAVENSTSYEGKPIPHFDRTRQFYLTFDVDLTRIPVKAKWLKLLFNTIGFLKIPAPALEINTGGHIVFHPLYF